MRYLSLTERNININYILEEGSVKFLIINLYFIENIKPKSNIKDVIEREIKKHGLDNYNIEDHFDFYTTNPETGYLSMPISSTPFDVSDTNLRELLTYDSVEDGEYLNGAIIIDVSVNNLYNDSKYPFRPKQLLPEDEFVDKVKSVVNNLKDKKIKNDGTDLSELTDYINILFYYHVSNFINLSPGAIKNINK